MRDDRLNLPILLALCAGLFFYRLGALPLLDTDEGMHAVTSLEMIRSGDWITPTFNGQNFYDKPAFFNWFVAASLELLGRTELAARLPATLFGTACVLATYLLGRRMFGGRAALLGAVVLATSIEFFVLSRVVVHDISLLACQTLALTFFYFGLDDQRRRTGWFLLFFASCGLAVLAKGPIGLLVPGAIIGLFLVVTRRLALIREVPFVRGILVLLALAAPWYVLISLRNEDYARYFFLEKNLGSFSSGDPHHEEPFYYYFIAFFGGFLPWSPFLPAAFTHAARELRSARRPALLYLFLWFGFTFLFFSAAASKLATYVLLLFPAASLLVGVAWNDMASGTAPRLRRSFAVSLLIALILGSVGLVATVASRGARFAIDYGVEPWHLYGFIGVLIAGLAGALIGVVRGRAMPAFAANAASLVGAVLFGFTFIAPTAGVHVSSRANVPELERRLAPDEEIACFRGVHGIGDAAMFYTGRRGRDLFGADDVRAYFDTDRRVYCLLLAKDWDRLAPAEDVVHVVHCKGGRILVSNQPDSP